MANKYQPEVDKAKKAVIRAYHACTAAHKAACDSQCVRGHNITADLVSLSLEMKKLGLQLDGCMDDGSNGGVTVQSGGT